jgi:hypothetical protein
MRRAWAGGKTAADRSADAVGQAMMAHPAAAMGAQQWQNVTL